MYFMASGTDHLECKMQLFTSTGIYLTKFNTQHYEWVSFPVTSLNEAKTANFQHQSFTSCKIIQIFPHLNLLKTFSSHKS